ncbi:hypothetical protein [Acetobacter sp. DsW_063]|uniref:hypothetical protein n=1 Tax=Acetobacter sp. DsW_063 TaxID=1514894 RepID=UPI000A3CE32F|nr:hypothetical protein [Acetobacter sp. DsW_063]
MVDLNLVKTANEFKSLNEGEILNGYLDGFYGGPKPGYDSSESYRRGWVDGRTDSGLEPADETRYSDAGPLAVS